MIRPLSRRHLLGLGAAAAISPLAPAFAKDPGFLGPVSSIPLRLVTRGKLATRTEIVAGQRQVPMLGQHSPRALDAAVARYRQIVSYGGWSTLPNGNYGPNSAPDYVMLLRTRLTAEGYLSASGLSSPSASLWDGSIESALKTFQRDHGALASGSVDARTFAELNISAEGRLFALEENVPRVAEYLKGLGNRYVIANIPAAQLETVENGEVWSRHNIVVGKPNHPTPSLKSRASDVIFNPTWTVPASIVENEIAPKMVKDPSYLEKSDMQVFDGKMGYEVDAASIDWENVDPNAIMIVQNPGARNSLADVKVNFANKYSVYMHDTPHRDLFATNNRFESHGCCRVDKVVHLITWLMNGQDGYDEANFDGIVETRETQIVKLQTQTDIRFAYLTAWATGNGRAYFRPDVYQLSGSGFTLGQPEPLGV